MDAFFFLFCYFNTNVTKKKTRNFAEVALHTVTVYYTTDSWYSDYLIAIEVCSTAIVHYNNEHINISDGRISKHLHSVTDRSISIKTLKK